VKIRRAVAVPVLGGLLLASLWLGWRYAARVPDLARWDAAIRENARAFSVDPNLLRALVAVESGGRPDVVSKAGAVGLCQLMPQSAAEQAARLKLVDYREDRLAEPALNLELGASFLARLLERFDGEVAFAVAAYNAGPARVLRWRARAPDVSAEAVIYREGYEETRKHLQRVLRFREAYRERYGD
jgi:soluble lytic murein transglycosylase